MTAAEPHPDTANPSSRRPQTGFEYGQVNKSKSDYMICTPIAAVMARPDASAECVTEALYGESLDITEHLGDWSSVCLRRDGYKGFIQKNHTIATSGSAEGLGQASHWVCQRSTLLFSKPTMKSQVMHRIPFGSELQLLNSGVDSFSKTSTGHYVWTDHCLAMDQTYPDKVLALATSHFLGTPYRWGGRSPQGIDCSGLIQALARSQGIHIPRDSGDQETYIQTQVPQDSLAPLDLIYWPGHTGILTSTRQLLHATAFTLDCRIEALQDVVDRAGPISSVRRLFDTELHY